MGDMRIVQEMYARGFEFEPIDIFRAQSRSFQIVDGKLMPSLNSIDGLGEGGGCHRGSGKDGPFLSKDDFRQRTKVSKTIIDLMDSLGLLGDLRSPIRSVYLTWCNSSAMGQPNRGVGACNKAPFWLAHERSAQSMKQR